MAAKGGEREGSLYTLYKKPPIAPSLVVKYFMGFLGAISLFFVGSVWVSADSALVMQTLIVCLGVLALVNFIAALVVQDDGVSRGVVTLWRDAAQRVGLTLGWCRSLKRKRGMYALLGDWRDWSLEVVHMPSLGESEQVYQLWGEGEGWAPQAPWVIRRVGVGEGHDSDGDQTRLGRSLHAEAFVWLGEGEGEATALLGVVVERPSAMERAQALGHRWRAVWRLLPVNARVVIEAADTREDGKARVRVRLEVPEGERQSADGLVSAVEMLQAVIVAWGEGALGRRGAQEVAQWLSLERDTRLRLEALALVLTQDPEAAAAACVERLACASTAEVVAAATVTATAVERLLCAVTVKDQAVLTWLMDDPAVGAAAKALEQMWWVEGEAAGDAETAARQANAARRRAWSALAMVSAPDLKARKAAWAKVADDMDAQGLDAQQRVVLIGFTLSSQADAELWIGALRLASRLAVGERLGERWREQALAWVEAAHGQGERVEEVDVVAAQLLGSEWVVQALGQEADQEAHREALAEVLVKLIERRGDGAAGVAALEAGTRLGVWTAREQEVLVWMRHSHGAEVRWQAEVTRSHAGVRSQTLTGVEVAVGTRHVMVGGQDAALNVALLTPAARRMLGELSARDVIAAVDGQWVLSKGQLAQGQLVQGVSLGRPREVTKRLAWLKRWQSRCERWPETRALALLQRLEEEDDEALRLSVWALILERLGEEPGAEDEIVSRCRVRCAQSAGGERLLCAAVGLDWQTLRELEGGADVGLGWQAQALRARLMSEGAKGEGAKGEGAMSRGRWALRAIDTVDEEARLAWLKDLQGEVDREVFTALMLKTMAMAGESGYIALLRACGAHVEEAQARVLVAQALASAAPERVAVAVILCGHMGLEDVIEWTRLLYRFGPTVDEAVAQTLGMLKQSEFERPLKELMRHPSAQVQAAAATSLGVRGDMGCIPALRDLLDATSGADPRSAAAQAAILAILNRNGGVGERGALSVIDTEEAAGALSLLQQRAHDDKGGQAPS